jgi:hypothetical protein
MTKRPTEIKLTPLEGKPNQTQPEKANSIRTWRTLTGLPPKIPFNRGHIFCGIELEHTKCFLTLLITIFNYTLLSCEDPHLSIIILEFIAFLQPKSFLIDQPPFTLLVLKFSSLINEIVKYKDDCRLECCAV